MHHSSNMGTWRWSSVGPRRGRRVAPITARTVSDSRAVRGTKMRCVFERGLAHLCGTTTEAAPPFVVFERWGFPLMVSGYVPHVKLGSLRLIRRCGPLAVTSEHMESGFAVPTPSNSAKGGAAP